MLGLGLNIFTLAIRRYFGGGGGQFAGSSLNLDFTSGNQSLDPRITFTRASTGTRINASGVMVSEAIDGPRFDYDPVTLQPKGLLIEEQRTNLLTYSAEFDNAVWGKSNSTVTANAATAPDGTATADYVVRASTVASVTLQRTGLGITGIQTHTASIYAKAATAGNNLGLRLQGTFPSRADVVVNLLTGAVLFSAAVNFTLVGTAVSNAGNGWYRISITATSDSTGIDRFITGPTAVANGSWESSSTILSDAYIWGAQLEAGAFPTSYIPTTTASATRAADVANQIGANFSNWFDSSKGTLFAEYSSIASGVRTIAAMNDGTANESIRLRTEGASPLFTVTDGGVDQANIDAGTVETNTVYRFAGAYAASDFAASINGGVAVTDTSGTLPAVNRMMIGNSSSGNHLNGHVRRLSYFPRRLSNEELRGITS